jgi:NTP pyrophosphatase (non-canonical NTP hydrolase)
MRQPENTRDLPPQPSIADFQEYVATMFIERGFNEDSIAMVFMLLLEEAGEFARAARRHGGLKMAADTHVADLADEAADVFILLLGLCNKLGIDLERAFRDKEEKNKLRVWK